MMRRHYKPGKPRTSVEDRLASWRRELEQGGQYASMAPRIIAELEAEIAALKATDNA